jgi:hypothetical protein
MLFLTVNLRKHENGMVNFFALEQNTTIAMLNHCELVVITKANQILTQLSKIASDEQSRIIFER